MSTAAREVGMASRRRTARLARHCDARSIECTGIHPGDPYQSVTIFPTHDLLGSASGRPYRMSICAACSDWCDGVDVARIARGDIH